MVANHEMLQRSPLQALRTRPNVLGYELPFLCLPWHENKINVCTVTGGHVPEQSFNLCLEKRLRCQGVNLQCVVPKR